MKKLIMLAVTITVVLVLGGWYCWAQFRTASESESLSGNEVIATANEATPKQPTPQSIKAKWLFVGDVFWGRYNQSTIEQHGDNAAYLFETLKTFNKDKYQAWIGNLECPVTTKEISIAEQDESLMFNCRPKYLSAAAKWFDVFGMNNNHTDNAGGQVGLEETRQNVNQAGLQYFGHYDNAVKEDLCEVVSLKVKITMSDKSSRDGQLPVALCGYHGVFKLATEDELDVIRDYSEIMPTIVMPHMGAEYKPAPDELKTSQYRAMVDRGADLVVGGHPHWVQSTEVYKDKLIVYSVGNFLFDQSWSSDVSRGMALDVAVSMPADENLNAWLELGEQCAKYKDDCLAVAKDKALTKIDLDWKFDVVASSYANGRTSKGDTQLQQAIEQRTNWAETSAKLGQ